MRRLLLVTAFCAAAAISGGAAASTMTATATDAFGFSEANFSDQLTLPQFGALVAGVDFSQVTGVTIRLSQAVEGTYQAVSFSSSRATVIRGDGPGASYVSASSVLTSDSSGLITPFSLTSNGGAFGTIALPNGQSTSRDFSFSNAVALSFGALAPFNGLGSLVLAFDNSSDFTDSLSGGNALTGGFANIRLIGEIEYAYNVSDVPVPAALPALLSAIGLLGVARARRRRAA